MAAGSIVRLKVKHFMTYDSMEITPCPGLNLITGPNGTGKSTLMCAMCLCLAGKPSSIGRSEKIADFIKTGYDQAYIEIELLNPDGPNIVIGRSINSSNTSTWTLNGKSSSLKVVEREISKFNIQTNNLCQFLPQEKVADFSKMNQKELLESTEQAVGDQSMYDNHMQLKQLRSEYCELESNVNGYRDILEREVETNKRLESEVTLHKEREKHLKRKEILQKKIPFMKYEAARNEFRAKQEERNKVSEECKTNSAKLEPMKNEIVKLVQQVKETGKATESLRSEIKKKKEEISTTMQNLEAIDSKVSDAKFSITSKIKDEENRVLKIQHDQTILRNLEEEHREGEAEAEDNQRKLAEISNELKEVNFQHLQVKDATERSVQKRNALHNNLRGMQATLARQEQLQQQRLYILKRKEPDVYTAVMWLRENQHLFKKKIYEPIVTLITVPDPQAVKYIENNISYRDLVAFFAEDPEDMNKFLKILCDDQGLQISGIHSPPVPEDQLQPKVPREHLGKYDLTNYLRELFTAPPLVMNYLCRQYKLHDIPMRYEYRSDVVRKIHKNQGFPFSKFYVGDVVFKLRVSRYGDHNRSSTSQKISDGSLLRGSADPSENDALKDNIKSLEISIKDEGDVYLSLCEDEKRLLAQLEETRTKKLNLIKKRDSQKNLSAKIQSIRSMLKILEKPVCNVKEEEEKLSKIIAESIQKKIQIFRQLNVLFEEIFSLEKEIVRIDFTSYFLRTKKDEAEKAYREATSGMRTLEHKFNQIKAQVIRMKGQVQIALSEAKKFIGVNPSEDIPADLKASMEKEFQNLPSDVTELETELAREQAKLNCINQTSPNVMKEYFNREKLITETRQTIATKEKKLQDLGESINTIRDQWLPAIEGLTEKISCNFSRYFASLGCAGEVTLDKTDNPNDFEKYGLSIKVKFRDDEPLNQLSHAHHSGGECSVSTILFMLSLQELTEVPFRCVDEINQGMDNINERSVFDLIVKSSCKEKKSQYFLITPKLLHGLDYPGEMEIAIIHNGSSKKCHWNIEELLDIKLSLNS